MGTFHRDKCALHGITVVVQTRGDEVFVGRCDDMDEESVILLDADVHREGEGGKSNREYLESAARVGVWGKLRRVAVPRHKVLSVRRLGEL